VASLIVVFAITAGLASAAEQRVQEVNYFSVEVHGIKVFYREAGPADGPPILLLHGFPASAHMFGDFMPKLADRYRLIAPDYPWLRAQRRALRRAIQLHVRAPHGRG
jgi:hypothetical protein